MADVGWTVETLKTLLDERRAADEAFHDERDRRYTEVNIEKEKALKIKEEGDKQALLLARDIQTYKDEKANELREQIASERNLYATKGDLTAAIEKVGAQIKPLADYMTSSRGKGAGSREMWGWIVGALGAAAVLWNLFGWKL
jgi:hypothetical protein